MLKNTISNTYNVVATGDDASGLIKICYLYKFDLILTDICIKNNLCYYYGK
ncbi:MAG: hypothetical protein ACI310_02065 [Bacilli bacterium]